MVISIVMELPQNLVEFRDNPIHKWMMTGGTPMTSETSRKKSGKAGKAMPSTDGNGYESSRWERFLRYKIMFTASGDGWLLRLPDSLNVDSCTDQKNVANSGYVRLAWGSLMHPNFFSLMHPDFFSLMHPDIFNSFWHVTKHWEFSCNRGGQFFLACAPWRSLPRFGVAFAPWTSLASTEVWSLWSDLRDAFHARSQHLSQVTFKTLCLLLWTIFLEYIRCYVVKSFSSYLQMLAMLCCNISLK